MILGPLKPSTLHLVLALALPLELARALALPLELARALPLELALVLLLVQGRLLSHRATRRTGITTRRISTSRTPYLRRNNMPLNCLRRRGLPHSSVTTFSTRLSRMCQLITQQQSMCQGKLEP
jgi:hypothetical protein